MTEPTVAVLLNPNSWNAVDGQGEYVRPGRLHSNGKGGNFQRSNQPGQGRIVVFSNVAGFEDIRSEPEIFLTTFEKCVGYERQVEIDGVLQWDDPEEIIPTMETVPPEQPDKARFDAVWDIVAGELPAIPGGYKMGHLTLGI